MLSPLSDLYQNKSNMPILSYPQDLGSSRKGHYIAFTISKQQKSMFTGNQTSQPSSTPSVTGSISSAVGAAETALNNASQAVSTVQSTVDSVTSVVGTAASAVNSTLSTFNTVVGSAASVAGSVAGVSQTIGSAVSSGSILGGIQAGVTAVSVAGNALNAVSGLAGQTDAVVGSVGKFLSNPMDSISGAYDSLKNALNSPDKILSSAFSSSKVNPTISPQTLKPVGYINLYTPDTVNMSQKASYDNLDVTRGALGTSSLGKEAGERIGSYSDAFNQGGLGSVISKASSDPLGAEMFGKAGSATGLFGQNLDSFLLAKGGFAINPQLEVIFNRMEFRTFQFTFTFTPKSKQEAKVVRDIIKQFRFHAAPESDRNGGGRYFLAPSVFNIEYMFSDTTSGKSGPNTNLHKFAPCVLTGITVDYAQDVGWVTFDDGMPVKTSLTLKFQETEILTKENIMTKGY